MSLRSIPSILCALWLLLLVFVPKELIAQPASALVKDYSISLSDLGLDSALRIRGVDGSSGLSFNIPATVKVQQLNLSLDYRVSPSLLEQVSHLKVYLNDQLVRVVELSSAMLDKDLRTTFELPVHLLKEKNDLLVQLIGHYTWQCEDPLHISLWAEILPTTQLHFSALPQTVANDLSLLPAPFFNEISNAQLDMPFVMYKTTPAYIEAAAMVASWLGIKAAHRGAAFTVLNTLPQVGDAVVFWDGSLSNAELAQLAPMPEGGVRMITNPNDPFGKLLVIQGNTNEQIKLSAKTIALAAEALSGNDVQTMSIVEPARQPYDAPAWIPIDRPISFKEIAPHNDFTAKGFFNNEVRLPLRLPPDLFAWKGKEVPMDLRYFYTLQSAPDTARLQVRINYAELTQLALKGRSAMALTNMPANTGTGRAKIDLPLDQLGSIASIQFNFLYQSAAKKECELAMVDTYRSGIDPNSTVDFSGFQHFMAMPNLAAFSTAGYPFSKMADLSETVAVLSATPTAEEFSTLLTLIGHMGFATGYPATRLQVQYGANTEILSNKDVLLLSIGKKHPLLAQWEDAAPKPAQAITKENTLFDRLSSNWVSKKEALDSSRVMTPLIELSQFESPLTAKRTVVAVTASDGERAVSGVRTMVSEAELLSKVQGGITIIGANDVVALEFKPTYYVGQLSIWMTMVWYLEHHPQIVFLLFLAGALLVSSVLFLVLRAQAQRRLNVEP